MNKKILAMFAAGCLALNGIAILCSGNNAFAAGAQAASKLSGDPMLSEQWALDNMGQIIKGIKGREGFDMEVPQAWDFIKENFVDSDLSQVVVAILDSGVNYGHEDLQGKILMENGIVKGYDFVNKDADPADDNGHGTIISGIIAAVKNNGKGIAGISDKVKIMPIKVLDNNGSGTIENLKRGIRFAADNGANIINMSLVGTYDPSVSDAISYAYSKNIVIVSAAGSENIEIGGLQLRSPISNEDGGKNWILGVSSLTNSGLKGENSNYGAGIDVSAPGASVLSTYNESELSYVYASGTSLAAANVSGVAALIKSCCPDLSNANIIDAIIKSADLLPNLNGMGAGMADAYNAILYASSIAAAANPTEGALIRLKDTPTVYYVQNNQKRGISRKEIFEARKFSWDNIEVLNTKEEMDYVPDGRLLGFPKGYVVKGGALTVYLIEDNEIARPFATPEAFLGMGFKWEDIYTITDYEITQSYTIGEAIR